MSNHLEAEMIQLIESLKTNGQFYNTMKIAIGVRKAKIT